jgi:hypothetical protein
MLDKLRLIAPLHMEEVHVLVRADRGINRLADLAGKRVLTPSTSEGSWVTAQNLLRLANMDSLEVDRTRKLAGAVCDVVDGKADAVFITTGQPAQLLTPLDKLSRSQRQAIKFLPLSLSDLKEPQGYITAKLTDYPKIGNGSPVDTLAVRALLVAYDFTLMPSVGFKDKCALLGRLGTILKAEPNLRPLLQHPSHSKWNAVDLNASIAQWKVDEKCTWPNGKPELSKLKNKP